MIVTKINKNTSKDFNPHHDFQVMINSHLRSHHRAVGMFKCYRWTGKRKLYWNEFLKWTHASKPLLTIHISFVSKTYLNTAPNTHNGLAKISVPSMLHFDEKIKFHEFCSK